MATKDNIQGDFEIGDVVNVPCVVTGISGSTQPVLTLQTKYPGFNGSTDTVSSLDSIQVIKDK